LLELLDRPGAVLQTEPYGTWLAGSLRSARRLLRGLLRRQSRRAALWEALGPASGPGRPPKRRALPPLRGPTPPAVDLRFQRGLVYPVEPAAAETAVQLRRWLAARPGGASAEDAAQADLWLAELREAASPDPAPSRIPFPDSELHVVAGILLVPRNPASRSAAAG
ncbi:MAG TPA: hypothetical protein VK928_00130, partial [Longimicrobiales bacterium]|nr:hypothetical protein [Longimicrobiales bacterium]